MFKNWLEENPDAVFILRTGATSFTEYTGFWQAGYDSAMAIFENLAPATEIIIKPNLTVGTKQTPGQTAIIPQGVVTEASIVAGLIDGLRDAGTAKIVIVEKNREVFSAHGYDALADPKVELLYIDEQLDNNCLEVKNGVVMRSVIVPKPIGDPDTVLVNVPTMKAHNLAIVSASVKNLQGLAPQADELRHFCGGFESVSKLPVELVRAGAIENLERGFKKHQSFYSQTKRGWTPEDEALCQRALDMVIGVNPFINVVAGVIGRSGTGFHQGDNVLANLMIFGTNAVHVDAVVAWLMGHDPSQIGFLAIARERGMWLGDVMGIPIFEMGKDGPKRASLQDFKRLSLSVIHRGKGEGIFIR